MKEEGKFRSPVNPPSEYPPVRNHSKRLNAAPDYPAAYVSLSNEPPIHFHILSPVYL
jgi:hypothetical protein